MLLQLIPARYRATIAIISMAIAAIAPQLVNDLATRYGDTANLPITITNTLATLAAFIGGATWLANITPDHTNPAIQARRATNDDEDDYDIQIGITE